MSLDFAKQPDIRAALTTVHWDLVIADDVERVTGQRADVLKAISGSTDRMVIGSSETQVLEGLYPQILSVVKWRPQEMVDLQGKALAGPRPTLTELRYRMTEAELGLAASVEEICLCGDGASGACGGRV